MNNQKFPLRQSGEMIQRAIDGALYPDGTLTAESTPADAAAVGRKIDDLTEKIGQGGTGGAGSTETLPFGGSKEWLEIYGDKKQLYQIDGYVWGFIESDGWTKSGVRYRLVSSVSEMTDAGGTPYMLRVGNVGTVYTYTAESGDAGVPVFDSLPKSANEGDVVAVGGRKYRAALSAMQVPNFTNLADPSSADWWEDSVFNSVGEQKPMAGYAVSNFIGPLKVGDVIYVEGLRLSGTTNEYRCTPYRSDKTIHGTFGVSTLTAFSTLSTPPIADLTFTETGGRFVNNHAEIKYWRIGGLLNRTSDEVVITVNEEITYRTETVVSWKDIGAYVPPVSAKWNETDLTYDVTDSIAGDAANGDMAVYSEDGHLYTYVAGADWMATSRYEVPSLKVDSELSDASENAVSNRAVTEAVMNLRIAADRHDRDIDAISERVTVIETGTGTATIPSFWKSAVDACTEKIKKLQNGRNCVTFPFFSDNHTRDGAAQYMGILIAHIMRECGIPYCFYGGDAITNAMASTADSDAEFREQAAAFARAMSYIPDGRFCMALGNHETWLVANPSIAGSVRVDYNRDQTYDIFLRDEGTAQNKHFGGDGTYYYVDDIASRVRFIILNTNGIGNSNIDAVQLAWLDETALTFDEAGWAAVIISHVPITNHYEQSNIPNAADVVAIVNAHRISTSPNRPDIIGWFSGHIHRDRIYTGMSVNDTDDAVGSPLGFTQVTITSDHTAIAYPVGQSPTTHPIDNSDKSHAIDFVTINRDTRTVNITRLGIGEDRSYTY